ncbi:hypothetical protein SHLA_4c001160 [Shinella sp. DD12]|nr:hypothetical protein SHLA_4c001160 [Shinella sp. DD12]
MNRERRCRLEQSGARIESLIWIPGATASDVLPGGLKDAISEDLYENNEQVLSKVPGLAHILTSNESPDFEEVAEILCDVDGFLAQIAAPIPTKFYEGGGFSYSWGYYQTKWVHADNLDELTALAEEFGKDVVERARANELADAA